MPQYLIMFNDEWVEPHTHEQLVEKAKASREVLADMRAAGVLLYADGGLDADTALCSVEERDGEPVFSDGPFAETKEHLGGYTAIMADDDDAARYWAGRLAVALKWPQEVHRFTMPSGGIDAPQEG